MKFFDKTKTCIVIGNGPSLRGFDLHRLTGIATLGMNAAYRHWDRIGWYPTFYACLDDQLIKTHHNEIERLFQSGLIQKFFLHGSFFDFHPQRREDHRFTSFDQTSEYWYHQNAAAHRLEPLYKRPAFRMSDPSKITTGAHSVRYIADLGFSEISLLGIDLRYVEKIPEAAPTDGIGLIINKTPSHNPNYFFDDYQKTGDRFNIPNPECHSENLHEQSFESIPWDFNVNNVACRVFNSNQKSVLSEKDIFPYRDIEAVTGESFLGCVFLPTNAKEIDTIIQNFNLWSLDAFAPMCDPSAAKRPYLVLIFNNQSAERHKAQIEEAFFSSNMQRYFKDICFEFLDLDGERDVYIRDYSQPVGHLGFKAGPNNQFFESLRRVQKYGRYSFLMETDCLPIRRNWLTKLIHLVDQMDPFWVMGSQYRGIEKLGKDYLRHINGNAVYASGDPIFQDFVLNFWEYHTWSLVKNKDKRLAYDCILEIMFSEPLIREGGNMAVWKQVAQNFRYTDFIQNISGNGDIATLDTELVDRLRRDSPNTYLLHNRTAHRHATETAFRDVLPGSASFAGNAMYPRLLLLDITPIGNGTATGEIKANLLRNWPSDSLLQIAKIGPSGLGIVTRDHDGYQTRVCDAQSIREAISEFAPDVILYRPVPDSDDLHKVAMAEIARLNAPLITWIMDDWPARMEAEAPDDWARMGPDLDHLIRQSVTLLSISEQMSEAFVRRYGKPFIPLANGIDPAEWPIVPRSPRDTFVIRYAGGMAPDMNRASLLQIAAAVDHHAKTGKNVRFEISTQPWWLNQCNASFKTYASTRLEEASKTPAEYRRWIAEADLVVICYNFDDASLRYIQHSMANKMPECLVSGAPVLAYGPAQAATIDYLAKHDVAHVVTRADLAEVIAELGTILESPDLLSQRAAAARSLALQQHNIHLLRSRFVEIVTRAARQFDTRVVSVVSPISPSLPAPASSPARATTSDSRLTALNLAAALLTGTISVTDLKIAGEQKAQYDRVTRELGPDHPIICHLARVIESMQIGRPSSQNHALL